MHMPRIPFSRKARRAARERRQRELEFYEVAEEATRQDILARAKGSDCCSSCSGHGGGWFSRMGSSFAGLNLGGFNFSLPSFSFSSLFRLNLNLFSGWTAGLTTGLANLGARMSALFPASAAGLLGRFSLLRSSLRAKKQGIWWNVGDRIARAGNKTAQKTARIGDRAKNHARAKSNASDGSWGPELISWIRGGSVYEEPGLNKLD